MPRGVSRTFGGHNRWRQQHFTRTLAAVELTASAISEAEFP